MAQLPSTSHTKHRQLYQRPADNACVGRLGLIAELCFAFLQVSVSKALGIIQDFPTHPLEHLLSPHIDQPRVQIFDLLDHLLNLAFIIALNLARLANDKVQLKFDTAYFRAAE